MTDKRITDNIHRIRTSLPERVQLLCVSKYHTVDDILQAYEAGERDFGESRVQELLQKAACLPQDIRWHFIGHLQTNKIKQVLPLATLIHGIDSLHLAEAVSRTAEKQVSVLLEVHIAQEPSKYGFSPDELRRLFREGTLQQLTHLRLCGLMGMASLTDDTEQIRREFCSLRLLFDEIKRDFLPHSADWQTLSMGMSDDWQTAVQEGSTLVRLGTSIFGERQ